MTPDQIEDVIETVFRQVPRERRVAKAVMQVCRFAFPVTPKADYEDEFKYSVSRNAKVPDENKPGDTRQEYAFFMRLAKRIASLERCGRRAEAISLFRRLLQYMPEENMRAKL